MDTETIKPGDLHFVPGGTTRSETAPPYHLNPGHGHRRVTNRFGEGAVKHGPNNWKKSIHSSQANAYKFCVEAVNHAQEHMRKMIAGEEPEDDHLGAIGWMVEAISYAEAYWKVSRWQELDEIPF